MANGTGRTRREVLRGGASVAAMAGLAAFAPGAMAHSGLRRLMEPAGEKLRVLFLGGTGFLGPYMVRHAMARGHDVTLFNRGKSGPDMFPAATNLVGDRYGDLTALEEGEWDVVIDTFTYVPRTVRATVDLLKDRIERYVVVSTISVYGQRNEVDMPEDAPVATMPESEVERIQTHREVGAYYGAMKALCEQTAEEGMPGRVWNVRPGLIVGPGDATNRFTYWPYRVREGGEVLAPGEPGHYTQVIDVRDLAEFIVLGCEKQLTGAYNAVSPARHFTMGGMLESCKKATESDAEFTWVPSAFLTAQGVSPWGHMPCWVPPEGDYAGFGQLSTAKATAAGMTIRPMEETVKATLAWVDERPAAFRERIEAGLVPGRGGAGLSRAREAEVLKAWHESQAGRG